MGTALLRTVGAVTAVYGAAVTAVPDLLAKPSGLTSSKGGVAPETRISLRPVAWRDAVSGLALVLAPEGAPLHTAAVVRIAADLGDAVLLGSTLPDPGRRRMAVAVSAGWGALSVVGLLDSLREGRS